MKYNEAIDMILDGGEAYRKLHPDYKYLFNDSVSGWFVTCDFSAAILSKNDFISTDWIVEKDGVVYDKFEYSLECPTCGDPNENVHRCQQCREFYKATTIRRAMTDGPAELEEPKQIIIDEDWLEKKMLCFVRRQFAGFATFTKVEGTKCDSTDCSFCFPDDHIPDASNMPKTTISSNREYSKNEISKIKRNKEEPRDKVTVEEMMKLIIDWCYDFYGDPEAESPYLKRRLEYLVSLQEKKQLIRYLCQRVYTLRDYYTGLIENPALNTEIIKSKTLHMFNEVIGMAEKIIALQEK